jgi:Mn2+/Fe2+ NRAMP family transporter
VERVLLVVSATLALYIVDGIVAQPDWSRVWHYAFVPHLPQDTVGWIAVAAALGTTLAPWGLAFIQSYAVDKKITLANLRFERVDVIIGSLLTGIIGLAIAVACAATLHRAGVHIEDARDAAIALRPLAGSFATVLFGAGLLGASLLAPPSSRSRLRTPSPKAPGRRRRWTWMRAISECSTWRSSS